MKDDKPGDLVRSVQDRLRRVAKQRGEQYQFVLTRYCLERLLYRLSQSPHRDRYILKGALLFQLWTQQTHRPTKDLDLLGRGANEPEELERVFHEVCRQDVEEDGLVFQSDTMHAEPIREGEEYQGVRVTCRCSLGKMQVSVQIDIGFGDAVTPKPEEVEYPTLLEFPAPALLAYPKETVVAEKFQAMVMLGMANSRMKDFYDLWVLARDSSFDGNALRRAIEATFERRKTALPSDTPMALSPEFYNDANKQKQWRAFVKRSRLDDKEVSLEFIAELLCDFLIPLVNQNAREKSVELKWQAGGKWVSI